MNYKAYAQFAARLTLNRMQTAAVATACASTAAALAYNAVRRARNAAFAESEAERDDSPMYGCVPGTHRATAEV